MLAWGRVIVVLLQRLTPSEQWQRCQCLGSRPSTATDMSLTLDVYYTLLLGLCCFVSDSACHPTIHVTIRTHDLGILNSLLTYIFSRFPYHPYHMLVLLCILYIISNVYMYKCIDILIECHIHFIYLNRSSQSRVT